MTIEIKIVDPIANFDNASELLLANWAETGTNMEFKLEDTRTFYQHLAAVGMLYSVAAYDEGKLIGYCIVTIVPYPFNHSYKVCNADGLYILPEYRGAHILARFMQAVEFLATDKHAQAIQWHAPANSPFAEALGARYEPLSQYFRKEVHYA